MIVKMYALYVLVYQEEKLVIQENKNRLVVYGRYNYS